jgi:hypothetical protein
MNENNSFLETHMTVLRGGWRRLFRKAPPLSDGERLIVYVTVLLAELETRSVEGRAGLLGGARCALAVEGFGARAMIRAYPAAGGPGGVELRWMSGAPVEGVSVDERADAVVQALTEAATAAEFRERRERRDVLLAVTWSMRCRMGV